MPSFKDEDTGNLQLHAASPKAQAELEHWEQLVFAFDMDNEPPRTGETNQGRKHRRSRSPSSSTQSGAVSGSGIHDAALLAQIAGPSGSGTEFGQSFAQMVNVNPHPFYDNLFHQGGMTHPQLPPISSLDFAWNQLAHQQGHHPAYNFPHHAPIIPPILFTSPHPHHNTPPALPALPLANNQGGRTTSAASSSQPVQQSSTSDAAVSTPGSAGSPSRTEIDLPEAERSAIAEEKRRRNTAASARFRIKKKQRTINLERSVSDLTSRAEELEKEVADLRRENGWLKEIVMLRGTRYAAAANVEQRLALSQAVQAAGIDLTVDGAGQSGTGSGVSSSSKTTVVPEEISSDGAESDDDYSETDKKGKGKKPASKGKKK